MRHASNIRPPVILASHIHRVWVAAYLNERQEFEVIPDQLDAIEVITDLGTIEAAAVR